MAWKQSPSCLGLVQTSVTNAPFLRGPERWLLIQGHRAKCWLSQLGPGLPTPSCTLFKSPVRADEQAYNLSFLAQRERHVGRGVAAFKWQQGEIGGLSKGPQSLNGYGASRQRCLHQGSLPLAVCSLLDSLVPWLESCSRACCHDSRRLGPGMPADSEGGGLRNSSCRFLSVEDKEAGTQAEHASLGLTGS